MPSARSCVVPPCVPAVLVAGPRPGKKKAPFLGAVVDIADAINRGGKSFLSRLDLQGQIQRIMTRLVQIAAMKPQRWLPGRLPHVAQFAFPGTRVFRRGGT